MPPIHHVQRQPVETVPDWSRFPEAVAEADRILKALAEQGDPPELADAARRLRGAL